MDKTFTSQDRKVNYIIKTLSRTKRKDYENYIVNAIWNRIDKKIKPVSQQYVNNPFDNRKHYFIDLYFPSINLGIECDEGHHKAQITEDKKRELTIHDVLHKLSLTKEYRAEHIDVTKSFDDIERQIADVVNIINHLSADISLEEEWKFLDASKYFDGKEYIYTSDNVIFKTHEEINKCIFNTGHHAQRGGYILPTFKDNPLLKDYSVWYPQLVIKSPTGEDIGHKNWYNKLLDDGNTIEEYNPTRTYAHKDKEKKIIFAKDKDLLGNNGYKFVGIFQLEGSRTEGHTVWIHKKISDKCIIIK